jgi:hypothetical protein
MVTIRCIMKSTKIGKTLKTASRYGLHVDVGVVRAPEWLRHG